MENRDECRLKAVQRFDQYAVQIVDSAPRTALYSYKQSTESWSKMDVEGTLMIYAREAPPHNTVIIINRVNKNNFMEPLMPTCDIQVNPPFLLFRNHTGLIYGIWFSANDDVHRISSAIRQKINENTLAVTQPAPTPGVMTASTVGLSGGGGSSGGGDIMSMLSRAHGDYENKRQEATQTTTTTATYNSDLVKPSPLRAGESSNTNVADFFAKVGMTGMTASAGNLQSPSSTTSGAASTTTNIVLQKLFQGAAAVGGQASVAGGSAPIPIARATLHSHSTPLSSSVPSSAQCLQELEGRMKENLHITPNKDEQNFLKPAHAGASSLLSPQVFTTSNHPEKDLTTSGESVTSSNYTNFISPGPSLGVEIKPLNGSRESLQDGASTAQIHSNITPLTHEQLVQAFSILLKKNDFVQQLHEAYIQALNQSLKGCL